MTSTFREDLEKEIAASPEFAKAFLQTVIREFNIDLKSGVTGKHIDLEKLTPAQLQEVALLFIEKHPKEGIRLADLESH